MNDRSPNQQAWGELPDLHPDSENPHFGSRYLSLGQLLRQVRPTLISHGLAVQWVNEPAEGGISVRCVIGGWDSGPLFLPVESKNPQAWKSAWSYARRMTLESVLGVCAVEDDDGEAAAAPARQSAPERDYAAETRRVLAGAGHAETGQPAGPEGGRVDSMVACPIGKNRGVPWAKMTERQLEWYAGVGPDSAKNPFDGAQAELLKRQDHAAAAAEQDSHGSFKDDQIPF